MIRIADETGVTARRASRRQFMKAALTATVVAAPPHQPSAQQAKPGLRVLAAGSALHGLRPAAAQFERENGIAVAVATDHGHNIRKHTLDGSADADVILVPTEWATEVASAGRADGSTLVAIGAVRFGAVVREDAPRPDLSSMDALRRSLVSASSVLLTLAPTGDHMMKVIERFGLTTTIAPKLKRFDTATLLNKFIAEQPDKGVLGFGPSTEILAWRSKGVAWGGPVPDEIQIVLPYSAAMLSRAQVEPARKFLAFLASAPGRKHFLDSGVE
jgi:molybdate transport system substrate-binding protein